VKDREKLINLINDALVIVNNNTWAPGGSEVTHYGVCVGCGRCDWEMHKDDCVIDKFVNDAHDCLGILAALNENSEL
jgi:hypothetical protein